MTKEKIREVVEKIFYSPATNGKAEESINNGVQLINSLLTPAADVQERAKELELFKRLWYNRNPVHENNADSGEDMFWGTAELVAREYAQHLSGASSLQAENERLKLLIEQMYKEGVPDMISPTMWEQFKADNNL